GPVLAGKQGSAGFIARSLYMQLLILAAAPENPLGVEGCGELARAAGVVTEPQAEHFDGIAVSVFGDRDEHGQFLTDGVAVMLEHRVTLPMARSIRILFTNRQGSRRPGRAA